MATELFYGLLPEQILLLLLILLMLLEILGRGGRCARILFTLAAASGFGVILSQLGQGFGGELLAGEIAVDRFALLAKATILGCGLVLGLSSPASGSAKFWSLLGASLLGALVIMDSAGFIPLFMGIELLSLPAFALMVHRTGTAVASEGAIKYLILSAVASALVLFGMSLAYGSTGTLQIAKFAAAAARGGALDIAASALVLSGLFLKAAVFPFHGWAPDAYSAARLPVTAFMASVVKAAVVLALVRLLPAAVLPSEMVGAVSVLAILSIFYGNVTGIRQRSFKRLLAYSSIAHAGYMIFALADTTGDRADALLYYVAVYALTTIVACAAFALLAGESDELESLDGAFSAKPIPAIVLALCVLSLAGIPPLPGFLGKLFIFKSVIASGHLVPAVIAFAGSYLGVVYYLRILYRLFKPAPFAAGEQAGTSRLAFGGMCLGTLALMLFIMVPGVFN